MSDPSADVGGSDVLQNLKNESIDTEQLLVKSVSDIINQDGKSDEIKIVKNTDLGGTELWSFSTGHDVRSSPVVVDGVVYVGSFDNSLYAVDAVERYAKLYVRDSNGWIPIYLGPNQKSEVIGSTQTGESEKIESESRVEKRPVSFSAKKSGTGSKTTFTINHPLGETPRAIFIDEKSSDALGDYYITNESASSFDIVYSSAPASGTDNLEYYIEVKP